MADYLNDTPRAVEVLDALARDGLATSLITFGEIYDGIYASRDPRASAAGFRRFLRGVDVLPLSRRIMQRFAQLRLDPRRSGQLIGDPDLLIAATALQHDLVVVTRNRRPFARVPGLKLFAD